jgi:hypothetical protein
MRRSVLDSKPEKITPPSDARVSPYAKSPDIGPPNPPLPQVAPGTCCMHEDLYTSDCSVHAGPYGPKADIRYFVNRSTMFGGICPTFAIDSKHRVLTISFSRNKTTLLELDFDTFEPRAALELPPREAPITDILVDVDRIFQSTAGGAYFVIDVHDRVVIPTVANEIWIVAQREGRPPAEYFEVQFKLVADAPADDLMTSAMPVSTETLPGPDEPAPLGYWFITERGRIGVARPPEGPQVPSLHLPGDEQIGNSCTLGKNGLFVVSDQALYRFELVGDEIVQRFRATYEQGEPKRGQIAPGSGTSPTLLGEDYVVIGDGAKVTNVCVYDQLTGDLVAKYPVFGDQLGSACENSFLGHRASIVAGNTYGYMNPIQQGRNIRTPGLIRLDLDESSGELVPRWYNQELDVMSSTPKLSLENGLIYVYTMRWVREPVKIGRVILVRGVAEWSLVGVDFETGEVVYDQPVFRAKQRSKYDNGWATLTLAPDGAAYLGMWRGAIRLAVVP